MTLLPDSLLPAHPRDELRPGQSDAIETARQQPTPTEEQEEWRYSRIGELDLQQFQLARPHGGKLSGTPQLLADALDDAPVRGVIDGGAVTAWDARTGDITILTDKGHVSVDGRDDFDLLNAALSQATHTVAVRPGAQVEGPVVIVDVGGASGELAAPRLRLLADDGSTVTFVHLVIGQANGAAIPVTHVTVGDNANATVVTVHVTEPGAWVLGRLVTDIGKYANLALHSVSLGGGYYSRLRIDASLDGESANLENRGLYLGTGNGMHDFRVHQRHVARRSTSRLTLRGAVRDRSEGVFTGVVRVERGAKGADGAQDARHLILEDGAHVDSVPNLEIEENDVACSHASSISPVDAEQTFYLESRGLPTPLAVRLLARGFLRDGETGLAPTALAQQVGTILSDELSRPIAQPLLR